MGAPSAGDWVTWLHVSTRGAGEGLPSWGVSQWYLCWRGEVWPTAGSAVLLLSFAFHLLSQSHD